MARAAERLRALADADTGARRRIVRVETRRPLHVAVASHDLKFMGEIVQALAADPAVSLELDHWSTLHENDEAASQAVLERNDVILCEWAGPNLAWYSNRVRPGQRLIGRLHGFELRGGWLSRIDLDRVDSLVFVSEFYREKGIAQLGLDRARTEVVPNIVDVADFRRAKLPGSEFRIGLVGWVSFGKRPDRALDVLEELLRIDGRYMLHVKGRMPWEYPHEWDSPVQRQLYLDFFARLAADPALREHVVFEPFGADIASWFRKIGAVLSPSDFESFHLAPAEGMASGAAPVFFEREGVREVFGDRYLVEDAREAARFIASLRDPSRRAEVADDAVAYAERWSIDAVTDQWARLLGGELPDDVR